MNGVDMNLKRLQLQITGVCVLCLCVSMVACKSVPKFPEQSLLEMASCGYDVLYFKNGEGIYSYKPSTGTTKNLYRCTSADEMFLQQEVLVTSNDIIFVLHRKGRWPYYYYPDSSRPTIDERAAVGYPVSKEFFRVGRSGGEKSRYATITRRYESPDVLLLDAECHDPGGCSDLAAFPWIIKLHSRRLPGPSTQEIALYRQANRKCVFESSSKSIPGWDKSLYLWDTEQNTLQEVYDFRPYTNYYSRLPPGKGGGGFFLPELMNEREVVYVRIPSVPFWVWMLGLGRYPCYLDKLDMETGEVQTLAEFNYRKNAMLAPRICPCGRHVVYCNWSPKCPEGVYPLVLMDLQTGAKVTIGTGHSVMWLK